MLAALLAGRVEVREPVETEVGLLADHDGLGGDARPADLDLHVEACVLVVPLRERCVVAGELRLRHPLQLQRHLRQLLLFRRGRGRRPPHRQPHDCQREDAQHPVLPLHPVPLLFDGSRPLGGRVAAILPFFVTRWKPRGRTGASWSSSARGRRPRRRARSRTRWRARLPAQARGKSKSCESFRMLTPSAFVGPPKYSPTIAPIIDEHRRHLQPGEHERQRIRDAHAAERGELAAAVGAHELDRRRMHGDEAAQRVDHRREEAEDGSDRHLRDRVQQPEPVVGDRREGDDRDRVGRDRDAASTRRRRCGTARGTAPRGCRGRPRSRSRRALP